MADTINILDNDLLTTQRLITAGSGTQYFSNFAADNSFSLDSTDLADHFRLEVTQRSSLILTLNSQEGNADFTLIRGNGTTVVSASTNTDLLTDTIVTDPLDIGTYYIRVSLPASSTTATRYSLTVNVVNPSRADLLWRNYSPGSGSTAIWSMNGTQVALQAGISTPSSDTNWVLAATGDFDNDNIQDYVWRNSVTDDGVIWLMDATNTPKSFASLAKTGDVNWQIVGAADYDGNGTTDIYWRNYGTTGPNAGRNVVWLMNGTSYGSAVFLTDTVADPNWRIEAVTYFNADRIPDLVWRNYGTGADSGKNIVWVMNGPAASSFPTLPTELDTSWRLEGAGDFNSDGSVDFAWRNYTSGITGFWLMNGAEIRSSVQVPPTTDLNWQIASVVNTPNQVDLAGNTIAAALNIGRFSTTAPNTATYNDRIGGIGDGNDFYRFALAGNTTVNLSLTPFSATTDFELIRDTNNNGVVDAGEVLRSSISNQTSRLISSVDLTAGNYLVRVFSSAATSSNYSFTIAGTPILPVQPVDLVASALTLTTTTGEALPTSVSVTSPFTLRANYQLQNTGSLGSGAFTVRFYISRDGVFDSSDQLLTTSAPVTLAANASTSLQQDLTLPSASDPWWTGNQIYNILMFADAAGQIPETNETNNTRSAPINIVGITTVPDLVGGGLTLSPGSVAVGGTVTISGSVQNIGSAATLSGFRIRFYYSSDDTITTSDEEIAVFDVTNPIAAGGSATFSVASIQLLNAIAGTRYVGMRIDTGNQVTESNEANNSNYGKTVGQFLDYNILTIA